eukprot:jgi/Bigna1/89346/estExt_fgenesh1_pg.C_470116
MAEGYKIIAMAALTSTLVHSFPRFPTATFSRMRSARSLSTFPFVSNLERARHLSGRVFAHDIGILIQRPLRTSARLAALAASFATGISVAAARAEEEACKQPGSEMLAYPIWRQELQRSIDIEKDQPTSKFMTLATVANNEPRARTVVFRGFLEENSDTHNALKIITDIRSDKIEEIRANPKAEIMWYFLDTREQFRIRGELQIIAWDEKDEEKSMWRENQWKSISSGMKQSYEWPSPGVQRDSDANDQSDFLDPSPSERPSRNFALLLMTPSTVDVVKLREKPQLRHVHTLNPEGHWNAQRVNP